MSFWNKVDKDECPTPAAVRERAEYQWSSANAPCSVSYVLPAVREALRNVPREALVLDAGCGNGAVVGTLKANWSQLHGIELSESGIEQARRAHPEVSFDLGDLTKDLSQHRLWGRCDVVISLEVVEHVFLPRAFALNCFGFLKPGGKLIVSTPYHGYLKNLAMAAAGKLDAHFAALWDFGHIKFWSKRTLESLLREAGFEIVEFQGTGRVPYLWKSMVLVARRPAGGSFPSI